MSKVALVTGGGRGIGKAMAVALAREGWRVAIASRTAHELEAALAEMPGAIAVTADVSDEKQVRAMVAATEARHGAIDLLVNNAGAGPPFGPLWECDAAEWWRNVEVNLKGPMLCCHAVLPGMVKRRRGRIVNVASGAGTVAIPHMSAYVTAKTALIRLTEVLAAEVKPHGIALFAMEPGTVRTAMATQLLASEAARRWLPWFEQIFRDGRDVSTAPAVELLLRLASGACDAQSGHFFCIPAEDLGVLRTTRPLPD